MRLNIIPKQFIIHLNLQHFIVLIETQKYCLVLIFDGGFTLRLLKNHKNDFT